MISGLAGRINRGEKLKGTMVFMQREALAINEVTAIKSKPISGLFDVIADAAGTFVDTATSIFGRNVALKLISATVADGKSGKGKVGKQTFLEGLVLAIPTLGDKQSAHDIHFEWNSDMGIPGAFYIENFLENEFFLVSLTLEDVPNHGSIHFVCNSWVYNAKDYKSGDRIFFANKPLAIELSKPHAQDDSYGPVSDVYLPAIEGVEARIWLLAKAYVVVNDSCYHQLVSHWLNTHVVVEPFIIATNRHLSVVHPIHKLLLPHYRDTMNINSLARNVLVNAEGIIESTFLGGGYALEMSAVSYRDWVFPDQGLPNDLLKRGVAVEDPTSPHGIRLLIEDYPYASDGLEIWAAIKSWVEEYVNFYYKSDAAITQDAELQEFWKELVEVGHGDLKNATWWFKMQTRAELIEASTILIWITSALHAAVNFGQYPYGGYILNRPTKSRRFMPEKGSPEYDELAKNYEKAYLRTITPKNDTLADLTIIEVLSKHASDEQYLGQRVEGDLWTSDSAPVEAYKKFGRKLAEIEQKLIQRNNDESLRNRYGPVKMPYTLLYPSSEEGLTFRGIPNSEDAIHKNLFIYINYFA
ncbi:hypothetical protein TSUD_351100 [Trifolium subterraneum]|uniref:Lipoxygenase n=1 Tax=Trifolium subterraneum TaxID=3900 RepID=A0A2Z6P211_TRISU|nr:hypothetical protein TSUD_351100 [Trifolium subterraneum]